MMVDNSVLADKLLMFGLNSKEVEVYLTLISHEWITALQLSRKCSVKRTTLYRMLEHLLAMGVVEERVGDKTTLYAATTVEQFENLIREREQKITEMRAVLPELKDQVGAMRRTKPMEVSVRFYQGLRGLQYLNLKHTKSKDKEVLIIDSNQWDQALSREFAEELRARNVKNKVKVREITNAASDDTSWTENEEYLHNYYSYRVLPKEVLQITQDIYIFDEVIQFSGYHKNDLVGVEIESKEYASMMKQMFEILWKVGKNV